MELMAVIFWSRKPCGAVRATAFCRDMSHPLATLNCVLATPQSWDRARGHNLCLKLCTERPKLPWNERDLPRWGSKWHLVELFLGISCEENIIFTLNHWLKHKDHIVPNGERFWARKRESGHLESLHPKLRFPLCLVWALAAPFLMQFAVHLLPEGVADDG